MNKTLFLRDKRKGFTLIEILIVVAIIGILASVILASVTSSRARARDTKRISDIRQIRTALELYFGANGRYPKSAELAADCTDSATLRCLAPKHIPTVPKDPFTDSPYNYVGLKVSFGGTDKCLSYHLGGTLEESTAQTDILNADSDFTSAATNLCSGEAGSPFNGLDCKAGGSETDKAKDACYDFTP